MRMQTLVGGWEEALSHLKTAHYQTLAPPDDVKCCACKEEMAEIFLCRDCGPYAYFCGVCLTTRHEVCPFHVPLIWVTGVKVNTTFPS